MLLCLILFTFVKKIIMNSTLLFLQNLGTTEIIIIFVIILLLFGAKRIPDLMKGIGKGIRSFKEGMNDVKEEIDRPVDSKDNADKKE